MKNIVSYLAVVIAIVFVYGFTFSLAEGGDAKKVFVEKKCTTCHSVEVEKIVSTKKKDVVDLSQAGSKLNVENMQKYLVKEFDLNGKKHKIAFKGTDDELKELSQWLSSLKK